MAKPAALFPNFPVNKHPSTSEVICSCMSTYEGCDLVPLVTPNMGDSELIIHIQEAYARLFSNCYNKQGIQSNMLFQANEPGNIFMRKYILKAFNQSREIIVD